MPVGTRATVKSLTPEELMSVVQGPEIKEAVELDGELFDKIIQCRDNGDLVVLMTAGPADGWLRKKLEENEE